jgi:hypothetical protein
MRGYFARFALLLPLATLLFWLAVIPAPALFFFLSLKRAAHGSGSVSFTTGAGEISILSRSFLPVAFDRAGWLGEHAITVVELPAAFLAAVVSLIVTQTANWHPASLLPSTWRCLIYPFYGLPAWYYVGRGIDALLARERVSKGNMITSMILALASATLCCGFRFGMSVAERQGQDRLAWSIEGLALWAVLFGILFVAWLRQRGRRVTS